ncbi:MAG: circadian clock KaiB family protein [Methanospirillum sp.]
MLTRAGTFGTRGPTAPGRREQSWLFQIYVVGRTPKALMALQNLKRICQERVPGRYTIEMIDLLANPELAAENRIIAVPTLIRRSPEPVRRVIGDLSSTAKVLTGLDLEEAV